MHSASVARYLTDIEQIIRSCHGLNVIYTWDINLDLLSDDNAVDAYRGLLASCGLDCLIYEPTRIVGTSQNCIDHLYTRFIFKKRFRKENPSQIQHLGISDPSMIVFKLWSETVIDVSNSSNESYSRLNYVKLDDELRLLDWNFVYLENSISNTFGVFLNTLLDTILDTKIFSFTVKSQLFCWQILNP